MTEAGPRPKPNRLPGRLVVWAIILMYVGFFLTMVGLVPDWSPLIELGRLCASSVPILLVVAIICRLTDPNEPPDQDFGCVLPANPDNVRLRAQNKFTSDEE